MASDGWQECSVVDVAASVRNALVGGPFGSNLVTSDYTHDGVPVIRGQNMGVGRWVDGEFAFVSTEKAESLSANLAGPGDLIFTQRGTLGQVALVPSQPFEKYLISQSQMKLTIDANKADALFLYYVFLSDEQQDYIKRNAIQTGVPHTNLGILRDTPILLPSLPEQQAIAHILGTLDDKIELNRQMNKTLEAMARAIFKSWFVDFESVPSIVTHKEWEDSPLGRIPKGWRNGTWEDLITLEYGRSLKGDHVGEGPYPVYGTNGRIGSCHTPLCEHPGIIIGRKGAYRGVHYSSSPFFVIDTAFYVKPRAPLEMRWAFYEMIRLDINGMDSGSAIPSTSRGDFYRLPVLIPPYEVQRQFVQLATPLWLRQDHNLQESLTPASIRDTLLPKLLSGEIRISDAELLVGEKCHGPS